MKIRSITIAAVLALQVTTLFAGNDNLPASMELENSIIAMTSLAPATPAEATFEEIAPVNEISAIVPVVPGEATFEDVPSDIAPIGDLSPALPAEADFE